MNYTRENNITRDEINSLRKRKNPKSSERLARVLELRLAGITLRNIGKNYLGVTPERVRQMEAKGVTVICFSEKRRRGMSL